MEFLTIPVECGGTFRESRLETTFKISHNVIARHLGRATEGTGYGG